MIKQKTILLVEDNRDDEELTIRAFKKNNIKNEVFVARDGSEALDWLLCKGIHSTRNPDELPVVVFLDLKLPKINGHEVLRQIRENSKTKFLPVVVLTTSKEEQDIRQSYALGTNSYIRKPVDFIHFVEAVKQLGLYWLNLNENPYLD